MKKTILIDASLTGGRGAAKQAYELVTAFKENSVNYKLITNKSFVKKLEEVNIKPDIVLDAEFGYENKRIYQSFSTALTNTEFDLLVKCGARTASTYICNDLKKPFIVIDGGLPDKMEEYPSLYAKEGYLNAKKYLITTHFLWKYPQRLTMDNILVSTYPFSKKTLRFINDLKKKTKTQIRAELSDNFPELKTPTKLVIQLMITGDFITNPLERVTYGGWLKTKEYDETIGFIRRFLIDLEIQSRERVIVILDKSIFDITQDIFQKTKKITPSYNQKSWDYYTEIKASQAADIIVSRATNYVPNIALLGHGGLITTPVPAHGYMDEDSAALQAYALGYTKLIEYDDEDYMKKLLAFSKDIDLQTEISKNLINVSEEMLQKNNCVDFILNEIFYGRTNMAGTTQR